MKKPTVRTKVAGALRGRSGGFTLIEVLVALALFGIIAITFAGGLSTASRAALTADIRATAESLARSQMEYVKNQGYHQWPWSYEVDHKGSDCTCDGDDNCPIWSSIHTLDSEYAGYTVRIEADEVYADKEDIQQITVTVSHEGRRIFMLVGYKMYR